MAMCLSIPRLGIPGSLERLGAPDHWDAALSLSAPLAYGLGKAELLSVTVESVRLGIRVVRGPDWHHGEEDGSDRSQGIILAVNTETGTAEVRWLHSGDIRNHYRIRDAADLAHVRMPAQNSLTQSRGPAVIFEALRPLAGPSMVMVPPLLGELPRRCSQSRFSDAEQTAIILDWDDTLFPSNYIKNDLRLHPRKRLEDQQLPDTFRSQVKLHLDTCAAKVCRLLDVAAGFGKVVIVTLARSPWVAESASCFMPSVGQCIKDNGVKVVYAQEATDIDEPAPTASRTEAELHWSNVKARAIAAAISNVYSQYEGQSWKNIISIGDSNFERLGTRHAIEEYLSQVCPLHPPSPLSAADKSPSLREVVVDGHLHRIRAKTFKMMEQPSWTHLCQQIHLLEGWLPKMVPLDDGFDLFLKDVGDAAQVQTVEQVLRGSPSPSRAASFVASGAEPWSSLQV